MATIQSENDLRSVLTTDVINLANNDYWILVENHTIDYDLRYPLASSIIEDYERGLTPTGHFKYGIKFKNCIFNKNTLIHKKHNYWRSIYFDKCTFSEKVIIQGCEGIVTFSNECRFLKEFNANNTEFNSKISFWECHFEDEANFRNAKFNGLVDFWRSTFYKKTIFYKTDFLKTVVFSAAIFKENVLFTYTLIDKLMLLRGTKAEKGFDLSLAIINGKLGLFEFNLDDYKEVEFIDDEEQYEEAVSKLGIIPIKNKRETFRILKDNLESQKNLSESLKYKAIEKEILRNELSKFKNDSSAKKWEQFKNWLNNRFERINLWLNKRSNDHGNSYGRAFAFIIIVGWIFFYISLLTTQTYSFIGLCRISEWDFTEGFKLFIQYLNPIHKLDYIESEPLSLGFYISDFLGKTFVGYGIYQFIQAFRKYK